MKRTLTAFLHTLRSKRIRSLHEYVSSSTESGFGVPYPPDLPPYSAPFDRSRSPSPAPAPAPTPAISQDYSLKAIPNTSQNIDPRSSSPAPAPYPLSQPPFELPVNAILDNLTLASADKNAER